MGPLGAKQRGNLMSAIERVMKAYTSKHHLNPEQAALVRSELSSFIDELMSGSGSGQR